MNHEKNDSALQGEQTPRRKRGFGKQPSSDHEKKDQSRRWLFWTVDILLVVAIVAAVLVAVSLLTPFSLFGSGEDELRSITYTVEFVGVDSEQVSQLKVGDTVTDVKTGSVIGTVSAINNRPYEVYTDTPIPDKELGEDVYVVGTYTYPDSYVTLTVTISVTAEYRAGLGYSAEDCRIAVGSEYELRFPSYTASGSCIGMRE
ncbi:MAG: DUF4330 family protein [Clostridia bacterium]|nr:DUF4330 family protein [Clostridia bacterium]